MFQSSAPPTAEALLAHAEWIRALARSLVHDPDAADELVQRTLVAAWLHPPREPGSPRGWLARCLRNFAHSARRARERRGRHEVLAARAEALPSAHDVVERASLSRELVEHVLALEEPYRTTILLRYFDEQEPSEIARELGLPPATVRTHVARGLARLRERLDRRPGGRDAWSVLLVPLFERGATTPYLPLLAMNTSLKIAVPAVLGLVALTYLVLRPEPSPPAPGRTSVTVPASAGEVAAADPAPGTLAPAPDGPERAVQPAARTVTATKAPLPPPAGAPVVARGRVLDVEGNPCAHVRLAPENEPTAIVTSAADGTFAFPGPLAAGRIRAIDPGLATVLSGLHGDARDESELVVVVAPAVAGEGSVADDSGVPLEDVRVHVDLPDDLRGRLRVPLDRSIEERCEASTDERGWFTLAAVPRLADARLVAERAGFQTWASRLDEIQSMPIAITLLRPGQAMPTVSGRVIDVNRQPVEAAYVAFGRRTMRTAADGSFRFEIAPAGDRRSGGIPRILRAAYPGSLPAAYEPPLEGGSPRWPAFVELQLGAPALVIEGKVLDHAGKARAGLKVWLVDSTTFGAVERMVQLESLLAGEVRESWRYVETDGEGRFRIEGLLERSYTLAAMEPETLLRTEEKDVPAGSTGVVLRMPEAALFPRVAGIVRGHDGRGIAGATIGPMCDAFRVRWDGDVVATSHDGIRGVRTDAEGRFVLENVPRSLVYLRIDGEGILPLEYGRYVEGNPRYRHTEVRELPVERIEDLQIVVDRRAHVQVELADPAAADEFALVDERGNEIEVSVFAGNSRREGMRAPIRAGLSDVVAGTDRGRAIVLFKADLEVARRAVALVPGETTSVRF